MSNVTQGPPVEVSAYEVARQRIAALTTDGGMVLGDVIARLVLDSGFVTPVPVEDPMPGFVEIEARRMLAVYKASLPAIVSTEASWEDFRADAEESVRLGLAPPPCQNHREVQYRDGKPPWCEACGWSWGSFGVSAALQRPVWDRRPHSRACGVSCAGHGTACAKDCPTCHGQASS